MTRPYHSASSVRLGGRCQRAWAYAYIDDIRAPDVPWEAIEAGASVTAGQRALALGKAVHATLEHALRGVESDPPLWTSVPGQIAITAIPHLPIASMCTAIEIEHAIGDVPTGFTRPRPPFTRELCGVRWGGFRDLAVRDRVTGAWTQYDYKTSAAITRWALTSERLHDDIQCALYAADLCIREALDGVASCWVYMQTKGPRRSLAVDTFTTLDHALRVIEPAAALATQLDALTSSADAPVNTDACYDFGGCQYARANGGPCTATRTLAAAYAQLKGTKMAAIDPALLSAFGQVTPPASTPASATTPAPAPGFGHVDSPDAVIDVAPRRKPRTPRAPKTGSVASAEGSLSEALCAIANDLVAAEAQREEAVAAIASCIERIRVLVSGAA